MRVMKDMENEALEVGKSSSGEGFAVGSAQLKHKMSEAAERELPAKWASVAPTRARLGTNVQWA